MTAAMRADISNKVVFRLNGYGTVSLYDKKVDNPDLIRECLAIMEGYKDIYSSPSTYVALALIDKYGGRILEVEDEGIKVAIS